MDEGPTLKRWAECSVGAPWPAHRHQDLQRLQWTSWIPFVVFGLLAAATSHAQMGPVDTLAVPFDGHIGQVEVGGPFAGVEFHGSRPLPARISFYYPVANSLDLSTDYWKRGDSRPMTLSVSVDGRTEALGAEPWGYRWSPYSAVFHAMRPDYDATLEYRFADELPVVVVRLTLRNRTGRHAEFWVDSDLAIVLRTSHAYTMHTPTRTGYIGNTFLASFDTADTDSVSLFVANVGTLPEPPRDSDTARFIYTRNLAPGDSLVITQLIGTSRQREVDSILEKAAEQWEERVTAYEHGIRTYVRDSGRFALSDPSLRQTDRLARALLRADRHYLDGQVVPMPSPAEYNFFFTHDLLLTDLGAVFFDTGRVREDLRYVQSLVAADSVLPHARYWRDSTYVIEPANADNWNHLWVNVLAASYLKHSGDIATIRALYPTLRKSMALMLGNERDGLMYAERPDWWDIGHVYGPRAYLTALTIRAVESYAFVSMRLGQDDDSLGSKLAAGQRMRRALVDELWDEEAGYLLNGMDSTLLDRHYYTGSLLAAAFDLLDGPRLETLLETAKRELLDEQVGMRNAMPADYHLLTEVYHFQEGEVGAPFLYMNGGVWPQGNAWYALGLITAGRVNEARTVLERYLSVAGVQNSPHGQPAFYEYRNADPDSPTYGSVDKPTFLWAGGWYLHVLYQLAGVRETPWNLSFSPNLPADFGDVAYDLMVEGRIARVSWSGTGGSFRRILLDGVESASAVLTGPVGRVDLERGPAAAPYLAGASCVVEWVRRVDGDSGLAVGVSGSAGQRVTLEVVGLGPLAAVRVNGAELPDSSHTRVEEDGVAVTRVIWTLAGKTAVARFSAK